MNNFFLEAAATILSVLGVLASAAAFFIAFRAKRIGLQYVDGLKKDLQLSHHSLAAINVVHMRGGPLTVYSQNNMLLEAQAASQGHVDFVKVDQQAITDSSRARVLEVARG